MKRRTALQSLIGLPAAGLAAGSAAAAPAPAPPSSAAEFPALAVTEPDAVAAGNTGFFTEKQMTALRKLADLLAPPVDGYPGAVQAEAPEFLDFYLSESSGDVQSLWNQGLDALDLEAGKRFGKPFAQVTDQEAAGILAPLGAAWTYRGPRDPFGQFLLAAKSDLLRATTNSRAWAEFASTRSRRGAGLNTYWHPLD